MRSVFLHWLSNLQRPSPEPHLLSLRQRLHLHIAELQNARNPGAAAAVIKAMAPGKARSWLERRFGLA